MRTLLLLAALSTASPALAGTLPITGSYGNDRGCSLYANGGEEAVYSDGWTVNDIAADANGTIIMQDDPNYPDPTLVLPTVIIGYELSCVPQGNTLGEIQCEYSDMNGDMTVTLSLDVATDTLLFGAENPEALHRCPASEPATM